MVALVNSRFSRTITLLITIFSLSLPAYAKYSGGMGEPNDPYQIATAEDLMLLGETPDDYDKHFILTADIDLDPNLPGRKVFEKAVIAADNNDLEDWFQGTFFSGVFDGHGHTISHLTSIGEDYLGLFGMLGYRAIVKNLRLMDINLTSSGEKVGSLAGSNGGCITTSLSMGRVSSDKKVGGLVGENYGSIISSTSTGTVNGNKDIGGLVGNNGGYIITSYSTGVVNGPNLPRNPFEEPGGVGGLVGLNQGGIAACFSNSTVNGNQLVGGLVGYNLGDITTSYSTSSVSGVEDVGGLVGGNKVISWEISGSSGILSPYKDFQGKTSLSFWDIQTSGQATSAGGTGLTTLEMQDINTFLNAGWDFVYETVNGTCDYWQLQHSDHPKLSYHTGNSPVMPEGFGTVEQPYLIRDVRDLGTIWFEPFAHYRLKSSIDLSGITWSMAIIPSFGGIFDGNDYVIRDLHIQGGGYLGLFGQLGYGAKVSNLGLEAVDINGVGDHIGSLSGTNGDGANITSCFSTGIVTGEERVGGLVGSNSGSITSSYAVCTISGENGIGGLIGNNGMIDIMFYRTGRVNSANTNISINTSYSTGSVTGNDGVGGLVGRNEFLGHITTCYSNGSASGNAYIGSMVGLHQGRISMSYGSGIVTGVKSTGGLVGSSANHPLLGFGYAFNSFWDVEASGQTASDNGTGKTTAEMQSAAAFLEAGWDFVGETTNGTDDIWWIDEGNDYPRLWWENDNN